MKQVSQAYSPHDPSRRFYGNSILSEKAPAPGSEARQEQGEAVDFSSNRISLVHLKPLLSASWLIIAAVIVGLFIYGRDLLVPLAVAVLVWYLINGLASSYQEMVRRLTWSVAPLPRGLALLLAVLTVVASAAIGVQQLAGSVAELATSAPAYADTLRGSVRTSLQESDFPFSGPILSSLETIRIAPIVGGVASAITSVAGSAGLIAIYVLFLLLEQRTFGRKIDALFKDPVNAERLRRLISDIEHRIEVYIRIKTLMSLLTGVGSTIILTVFGVAYPAFWGLIIFFLNYIPNIGSFAGVLLPVGLAFVSLDAPGLVLVMAALLGGLQFLIGNILEPKLMGSSLNLSPFVIIVSLALWGSVWGIAGMFLCVPLTMIFMIVCAHFPSTRPIAILLSEDGRLLSEDGRLA